MRDKKGLLAMIEPESGDWFLGITEMEATKEIIDDKDFMESIMRGDEDFKAGRFKKWSEVKE